MARGPIQKFDNDYDVILCNITLIAMEQVLITSFQPENLDAA